MIDLFIVDLISGDSCSDITIPHDEYTITHTAPMFFGGISSISCTQNLKKKQEIGCLMKYAVIERCRMDGFMA
jgi:hypothetical protein